MARFDPAALPAGKISWDPDNSGLGYRKRDDGGGAWLVRWWVTTTTGRRKRKTETLRDCPNRTQALGVLRARQGEAFTRHHTEKVVAPTLEAFAPVFLGAKAGLASVSKYRGQLRNHLLPALGRRTLDAITVEDCEAYFQQRRGSGASPATATKELRCLQSLFTVARKARLVTLNPVELVDFAPLDNERTRTLERAELDKLLARASQLSRARYMHTLLLLLWHTGFRISHALRLRWDELSLVDALVVTTPDKGATKVTLPLHDELVGELRTWKRIAPRSVWVFPAYRRKSQHRDRGSVVDAWKRVCRKAAVTGLWLHDVRRTFISHLDEQGASDKTIMAATGQRTPVVVRRYVQPRVERLRELIDARSTGDPPGK